MLLLLDRPGSLDAFFLFVSIYPFILWIDSSITPFQHLFESYHLHLSLYIPSHYNELLLSLTTCMISRALSYYPTYYGDFSGSPGLSRPVLYCRVGSHPSIAHVTPTRFRVMSCHASPNMTLQILIVGLRTRRHNKK